MIFTVRKLVAKDYAMLLMSILLIAAIICLPNICTKGAKAGLYIAANVLVPSVFPFAVPVLYLTNSKALAKSKRPVFIVYLLSLIGGYPIGGKLLCELNLKGIIKDKDAAGYLPFCVNAGPAFIVLAVGRGVLSNITAGYILLLSHCLASILQAAVFMPGIFTKTTALNQVPNTNSNSFAYSLKNASGTCINICAFVVFFSVVNEYLVYFSDKFKVFKYTVLLTEVTSAVKSAGNIYLISFLLGFAGISIWVQVYSVSGNIKPQFFKFLLIRVLHGALSLLFCILLFKVFRVNIAVISNGRAFEKEIIYTNLTLSVSLAVTVLLFLINITAKKHSGNFLKDVL